VNGKEYFRWGDVPSEARAAFQSAGVGAEAFEFPSNDARPQDRQAFTAARLPGVDVDDRPGYFSIGWRWFSRETLWMALFVSFVDAATVHWYTMPRSNHSAPTLLGHLAMFVFLVAAVGMTYSVLCGFFNSTKITLTRSDLIVARGPLPCGGNWQLSTN